MKPITPPQPHLTGGIDQPETPCRVAYLKWASVRAYAKSAGLPFPVWCFDELIERPGNRSAAREATDHCETCPAVVACLTKRNKGEEWVPPVLRELTRRRKAAARAS